MIDLGKDWKELPSRVEATNMRAAREMDRPPSPDTQPPWKIPELVLCGTPPGRPRSSARPERAPRRGFVVVAFARKTQSGV